MNKRTASNPMDNPYESPQTQSLDPSSINAIPVDWKSIARRWELLRIPYNIIVGIFGVLTLMAIPGETSLATMEQVLLYGFAANLLYLFGPITEMYLNWIVDAGAGRFIPHRMLRFIRSHAPTFLLFSIGLLLSILLTLAIGFNATFGAELAD